MLVAYFDCFSGVSGDMLLGALLDAGLELSDLQADVDDVGDAVNVRLPIGPRRELIVEIEQVDKTANSSLVDGVE